jgi:ketosteroid isomerase-like protein
VGSGYISEIAGPINPKISERKVLWCILLPIGYTTFYLQGEKMKTQSPSSRRLLVILAVAILVTGLAFTAYYRQSALASGPGADSLAEAAQDWADAFRAKDADRIGSYFATDGSAWYPLDTVPTVGPEAEVETWRGAFEILTSHPITVDAVMVAHSKDVGYTYGRWAAQDVPELGNLAGRWVATWQWTKDGWRITVLSAHIHEDVNPADILGE